MTATRNTRDLPPITAITFFAELERALPVPHGMHFVTVGERSPGWTGWPDAAVSAVLGRDAPEFASDQAPATRVVIRHGAVSTLPPLLMAEDLFSDWIEPVLPVGAREQRAEQRREFGEAGLEVARSVVALSRFVPRTEHPPSDRMTVGWVLGQFRVALAELNTFLDQLGMVTRDWSVSELSPRELPPFLPVLLETVPVPSPNHHVGLSFVLPLHDRVPQVAGQQEASSDAAIAASQLANAHTHGALPFGAAFPWFHRAFGEKTAGSPGRSVVELATGIEVLVSALVRAGGTAAGWDEDRIERGLADRRLRNRIEGFLGPLLGVTIDVEATTGPWPTWWREGYRLRNEAVHRGHVVTDSEAQQAWAAARALVTHLRAVLSLQPELQPLSDQLGYDLGDDPPWLDERVSLDGFPWEHEDLT